MIKYHHIIAILSALSLWGQTAAAAGWEAVVNPDTTLRLTYDQAPVVTANYFFFGNQWAWSASKWKLNPDDGDGRRISGEVPNLGLRFTGRITHPKPNVLVYEYRLSAEKELTDVKGGGVEFSLGIGSPGLGAAAAASQPQLLPDNSGWEWDLGDGRTTAVSFDAPIGSVYFEQGQRGRIRAAFFASELAAGDHTFRMTVTFPQGTRLAPSPAERYGPENLRTWHRLALPPHASPVDASFLNDGHRPAGRHGMIKAQGDRLVFEDGTEARFWGANLAAYALFGDKDSARTHARRIAQLGYNLIRIHHHDSPWVKPNVLAGAGGGDGLLNERALDCIDWWIACLKEQGVYVWLDLHVGRAFTEKDAIGPGFQEIARHRGNAHGFVYFNDRLRDRFQEFNAAYLTHLNPYTQLTYAQDPAIVALLVTNENDLTHHYGNMVLPDKNNPYHNRVFEESLREFCGATGLPYDPTWRTWVPGPSKIYLNDREHRFNRVMLDHLRGLGVKTPIATTNHWAGSSAFSFPSLTDGDLIDAHSYGEAESISVNPRHRATYLSVLAGAQLADMPLTISEWSVQYPATDRFTAPMQVAAMASLQGWDGPMIYTYSQRPLSGDAGGAEGWSTFNDPAVTALMPAAAIAFRRGDIRSAQKTYCLTLTPDQLYNRRVDGPASATIRTLAEQSRIAIALPDTPELSWDRPTTVPLDAEVLTDPDHDFIPPGQSFVESDTGEVRRDWDAGLQTIHTDRTIAAIGWMEGRRVSIGPVTMEIANPKATVVLTSLDDRPIGESRRILLTLVARAKATEGQGAAFYSEPITGLVALRSQAPNLALIPINMRGQETPPLPLLHDKGVYVAHFPAKHGSHWYILSEIRGQEAVVRVRSEMAATSPWSSRRSYPPTSTFLTFDF